MLNKIIKNASWIIICQIVQAILSFIIGIISARYLGPANYGIINYASSIVLFVTPIMQLGLRGTLVNEIVTNPEEEGETLGTAILMCVLSAIGCIFLITIFVCIMNGDDITTKIVCILYSFCLVFQALEMIRFWFQSKLMSKYTSIVSLIAYVIVSCYKVYLLITAKSVFWFAITYAIDSLIISVLLIILYKRLSINNFSFSFQRGKEMFHQSKHYILSGMMVCIFSLTDRVMLQNMIDSVATGYYSAAVTCAGLAGFIYVAIIDSLRPVILESKKDGRKEYETQFCVLCSIIFYSSIIQCIIMTIFAKPIISITYGTEYYPAIVVLQVVVWYVTFAYLGSVRNVWILAEKKQKYLWIINLFGAVFNVILNFILIPKTGILGAAAASVATQFFVNFVLGFIIKPIRECNRLILKSFNPKFLYTMLLKIKYII